MLLLIFVLCFVVVVAFQISFHLIEPIFGKM